MLRLDGKIAIVTGAGSIAPGWGNGKAIATLLARQGATVIGIDRNLEAIKVTEAIVAEEGQSFVAEQADVTDEGSIAELVKRCTSRFGRIDVLVNNVGLSEPGTPVTMSLDTWRDQLDVNVTSAFLLCKYVMPVMEANEAGAIVNVASIAGTRWTGKDQVGYAASKAALLQMTKVTAIAYARSCIRLNCVLPGLMNTPLVQRLAERYASGDLDTVLQSRHAQVPMGHMGDAWDVAHAALFLASDEARFITGTNLVVDGGMTCSTGKP